MSRTLLTAGMVALLGAPAVSASFVAYNDVVYHSSHGTLQPNVTTYNTGNNSPGPSSGVLVDKSTGVSTGVTLSLTYSGGVNWETSLSSGGDDCASGTDARSVFDPASTVSLKGTLVYGSTGWYVDATFTGLNPNGRYEFVTTANRNNASYTSRVTRYTISGADGFTNESTPGTVITNGGASTAFSTGANTANGYVARWTDIDPGADGSFSVRAQADVSNQAYGFDAIMLAETGAANAVNISPNQVNTVVGAAPVNGTVSIPAGSNASGPVQVTLTSDTPSVADLVGASGGVLVLTFPQGGATEQNIQIDIGQAGSATISSTNDAGLLEDSLPVDVDPGTVAFTPASVTAPSGAIRPVTVSISAGSNATRSVAVTLSSDHPNVAALVAASGGLLVLNFPQGGSTQQSVDLQLGAVGEANITATNNGGLENSSLPVTVQSGAVSVGPTSISGLPGATRTLNVSISPGVTDTRSIQVTLASDDPTVADLTGGTGGVLVLDFLQGQATQQTVEVQLGVLGQAAIAVTNNGGLTNPSGVEVTVAQLRSWVLRIRDLEGSGWNMVPTGGYDDGIHLGNYPLDGRYYWREYNANETWPRVYWRFERSDVSGSTPPDLDADIPSQPRLYTVEAWVPYLGEGDPRSWKQIDVYINGRDTPSDWNAAMVPWSQPARTEWIARMPLPANEFEGRWVPAGPGPHNPDGPGCDAGASGSYLWLKKGSDLYMDFSWVGLKYGVSALRITEAFPVERVCDEPVVDGPVDLRCVGNSDPLYTIGEGFGRGYEANIDGNTLAVEGYRWPCNETGQYSSNIFPVSPGLPYDAEHPEHATYTARLATGDVDFKLRYDGFNTLKWRADTVGAFSRYNVFTLNEVPDRDFVSGHFGRIYVLATKGGGSSGKLRVECVYSEGPSEVTEAQLYDWFNQDGDAGSIAVGADGRPRSEGDDVVGFERVNSDGLAPGGWGGGTNGGTHGGAFLFVHPVEVTRNRTLTQIKIGLGEPENFSGELVVLGVTLEAFPCSTPVFDVVGGDPDGLGPDGSVDQADFGVFQACFSGIHDYESVGLCRCLDINGDGKIDSTDMGRFEACATGPALGPPPVGCDQP